jgi:predicted ATPase
LFADWLSIPTGDCYPALNLTPEKRKEKTLHLALARVEGWAAHQPLLMVYEDVQWSDLTTRESLGLLIDRVSVSRILVNRYLSAGRDQQRNLLGVEVGVLSNLLLSKYKRFNVLTRLVR